MGADIYGDEEERGSCGSGEIILSAFIVMPRSLDGAFFFQAIFIASFRYDTLQYDL